MSSYTYKKYILFALLALLFIALPILSTNAGISGDEQVHLKQAETVIDYYTSFGEDRTALQTPVTNLKYYGQSFDNLTTLLAQLFGVEDIYVFRHICNAMLGFLCILFVALLALEMGGYNAAIFAVILMAASARFIGHSYNNLKDIPFALGYIASIYYMFKLKRSIHSPSRKHIIGLVLSMAFILSIRAGGLLVFCYFFLFSGILLLYQYKKRALTSKELLTYGMYVFVIAAAAYFIALLFWPFALENPLANVLKSMKMMSHYPVILRQLFEGKLFWSDQLPWYYIPKFMAITIPLVIFPLLLLFFVSLIKGQKSFDTLFPKLVLLFSVVFPLLYLFATNANVYGGWRHFLFIYPLLAVMASLGLVYVVERIKKTAFKGVIALVFVVCLLPSVLFMIRNHPLEYTYFNSLAGPYKSLTNQYEIDYYYHSVGEASSWLRLHLENNEDGKVKIASNYDIHNYFDNCKQVESFIYTPYYKRGNKDWDYGVFYRTTIDPSQTNLKIWPPMGTIKSIKTEGVPVCVIVKRQSKDDFYGKQNYEAERYAAAIAFLQNATHLNPANEIAWINLGKSYLKLDSLSEAKHAFRQCLNVLPNYEPSYYYLAQIECVEGNEKKAIKYYKKILKNNPKSYQTYLSWAQLNAHQGKNIEALSLLDECLVHNTNYRPALELRKEIIEKINN
ncbi:tetratricopeptide repeat protein [Saccharicrinis aurantiacus]|uniref:tetratricopeptide repeat protein n=1 Tax=Saccharicrinis aurantiacus TaxID=1849719 RepID=UPI002493471A|nr:tetratricopeptide repeat protein [Saccharicrinis aurantiacus]